MHKKEIISNTFYMSISMFVRLLTGVVLFVLMARELGVELFGSFVYWYSVSLIVVIFIDYGMGLKVLREIGRDQDNASNILAGYVVTKIYLAAVVLTVSLIVIWLSIDSMRESVIVSLLIVSTSILSFAELFVVSLRAVGSFSEETKVVVVTHIYHFASILLLLKLGFGLVVISIGMLASRTVFLYFAWRKCKEIVALNSLPVKDSSLVYGNIRSTFYYFIDDGASKLYSHIDTVILNMLMGSAAVGVYNAGMRIVQGLSTGAQVLANVFLPRLAGAIKEKNPERSRLFLLLFLSMTTVGLTLGAVLWVFDDVLVRWLYGEQYKELASLMGLFGLSLTLRYTAASIGVLLTANGLQRFRAFSIGIATICLFVCSVGLIPSYGLVGMLYAVNISLLVLNVAYLVGFFRNSMG